MRSASRPSARSVGTRSMNRMSSSMPTYVLFSFSTILSENRLPPFGIMLSRHQLVAAGIGDQYRRTGGVFLDLLPQPVNVGLERVGGDAGIVSPDLLQQCLARHRPLPGAIEITQDRGFLFGQADLAALGTHQQLRARPERVGTDGEDRILARLMLAKLRTDARQQHGKAEWLGDVV